MGVEFLWLKTLLKELGLKKGGPMIQHSHSTSSIGTAKNISIISHRAMGPLEHVCVEVKSMDFFSLTISKSKDIITMEFCYLNLCFSFLVQQ